MDLLFILATIIIVILSFYQILQPTKQKKFAVINKLIGIIALFVLAVGFLTPLSNYLASGLAFVLIGISIIFSRVTKR